MHERADESHIYIFLGEGMSGFDGPMHESGHGEGDRGGVGQVVELQVGSTETRIPALEEQDDILPDARKDGEVKPGKDQRYRNHDFFKNGSVVLGIQEIGQLFVTIVHRRFPAAFSSPRTGLSSGLGGKYLIIRL